MHVIECYFEFGGFDEYLVKGGISVYLWDLCRHLRRRGIRVSALTPSHGQLERLRKHGDLLSLDWHDNFSVQVPLDPGVWTHHTSPTLHFDTQAYELNVEGISVVVLDDPLLSTHPDTYYPPYSLKGNDLSFLKSLYFQIVATRYLIAHASDDTVVHMHEPFYHYLMPIALRDAGIRTVSTVQSNMPVNKKVYGQEVCHLLRFLGASESSLSTLDQLRDPPCDTPLETTMRAVLPSMKLNFEYPNNPDRFYLPILALTTLGADAVDFLSPGQLEHVTTQAGTALEQLFSHLAVRNILRLHPEKLVVGGCAIGEPWRHVETDPGRRIRVLTELGLDPTLPGVYHNSRYAPDHKGQREMARGIRRVLETGRRFNVLLHCLSATGICDRVLTDLAVDFPDLVRLEDRPMSRMELEDWAISADICLYPSKFEMDTFLLGMGEAMCCGEIPVATNQAGMRHFGHRDDPLHVPGATGLAIPRSFRYNDESLTQSICDALRRALDVVELHPDQAQVLRTAARDRARTFSWNDVAARFHQIFDDVLAGSLRKPALGVLLERGWSDLVPDLDLMADPETFETAAAFALDHGDLRLAERLGILGDEWNGKMSQNIDALFAVARSRCDVDTCTQIARRYPTDYRMSVLSERSGFTWEAAYTRVWWRFSPAIRVEMAVGTDGELRPMRRQGNRFVGTVSRDTDGVAFLVTLHDGREVWDWLELADE